MTSDSGTPSPTERDAEAAPRREAPARIVTARLVCERFTMDHVAELAAVDTDWDVQRWLFGKLYTPEETRARAQRRVDFWAEHGAGDYLVRTADGEFVGFAGFFPSPRPDAIAIGYALRPPYWRRGYGSELAEMLTAVGSTLGRAEIVATVRATNVGSRRILEKAGFVPIETVDGEEETLLYRLEKSARPVEISTAGG